VTQSIGLEDETENYFYYAKKYQEAIVFFLSVEFLSRNYLLNVVIFQLRFAKKTDPKFV